MNTENAEPKQPLAVIGTGIAGMTAAWLLSQKFDVTVYEKNNYVGGHSNTVDVEYGDAKIPVDTGFIVFNHQTYPNLKAMFEYLGVPTQPSNMSFGISAHGGRFEYAGTNLRTVFAQPVNLLNPRFLGMLSDIIAFNRESTRIALKPRDSIKDITLAEYLKKLGVSSHFRRYYLLPMAGAIWSCPMSVMMDYPAEAFINFFHNHGLLRVARQPQWYTVEGGSREYVKLLTASFRDRIRLSQAAKRITRDKAGVTIEDVTGATQQFKQVVLATPADEALKLLSDVSTPERSVLSKFTYHPNRAVLHRDESVMPKAKKAWASWVYSTPEMEYEDEIMASPSVHYWMNRLQNIHPRTPLFVSLNPWKQIAPDKIFAEFTYRHPVFDLAARRAQGEIKTIQGSRYTWYCGSYHGNGFHEDALVAALQVANLLGVKAPWQ